MAGFQDRFHFRSRRIRDHFVRGASRKAGLEDRFRLRTRGAGQEEHVTGCGTVTPIALETVSALGNVWKKFEKVNDKRCMGRNTDGKLSRNT